jgi:hypothetical protein
VALGSGVAGFAFSLRRNGRTVESGRADTSR